MQSKLSKKLVVFVITFLFFGCIIYSAYGNIIDSSLKKINQDYVNEIYISDHIEVSINIHNFNKIKNHKVKLSISEFEQFKNIIYQIKDRLNNTKYENDTVLVLNKAIKSLYELGLFPKDFSLDILKEIVINPDLKKHDSYIFELNEKLYPDSITNKYCQIVGETKNTMILSPRLVLYHNLMWKSWEIGEFLSETFPWLLSEEIVMGLVMGFSVLMLLLMFRQLNKSLKIGSNICFGASDVYYPNPIPSEGWILTTGGNGQQNISGKFYGHITDYTFFIFVVIMRFYSGVTGFNGLSFEWDDNVTFFVGFARNVNISPEPPLNNENINQFNNYEIEKNQYFKSFLFRFLNYEKIFSKGGMN
jgi:hypothetical protein